MNSDFYSYLYSITKLFLITTCLVFILIVSNNCFAQSETKPIDAKPETYFFSFTFKSRINPEFKLCVPITEEVPFQIEWKSQELISSLFVTLKKPENGEFPIRVTVTEGTKESKIYEGMEEPRLILDKPYKSTFIASLLFKNIYERNLNLSKKGCDFTEGSEFYWKTKNTEK